MWTRLIGSSESPMAGFCEHYTQHLHSIKSGKILDWLSTYQLLNSDSPPGSELVTVVHQSNSTNSTHLL